MLEDLDLRAIAGLTGGDSVMPRGIYKWWPSGGLDEAAGPDGGGAMVVANFEPSKILTDSHNRTEMGMDLTILVKAIYSLS